MAEVNPSLLVITLNVNGLNSLINKQRLVDWIFFLKKIQDATVRLILDLKTQTGCN